MSRCIARIPWTIVAVRSLARDPRFPADLVQELERLPGFRHILVHEYVALDMRRVVEVMNRLEPVKRFLTIVAGPVIGSPVSDQGRSADSARASMRTIGEGFECSKRLPGGELRKLPFVLEAAQQRGTDGRRSRGGFPWQEADS